MRLEKNIYLIIVEKNFVCCEAVRSNVALGWYYSRLLQVTCPSDLQYGTVICRVEYGSVRCQIYIQPSLYSQHTTNIHIKPTELSSLKNPLSEHHYFGDVCVCVYSPRLNATILTYFQRRINRERGDNSYLCCTPLNQTASLSLFSILPLRVCLCVQCVCFSKIYNMYPSLF